jgi:hypothetical protein
MYLGLPQIIYIGLTLIGLGITMVKHGQPKSGKENFWTTFVATVIVFGLLYWGGFFN